MKLSSTLVHGGLALAALGFAYATWQREPEATGESVIVLDASRKDLTAVRYDDASKWIELRPMKEGDGVWVKIGEKEPVKGPGVDAGTTSTALDGGTVTPEPVKPPDRELRGNEFAEKLFKRFAPLRAARALGTLDGSKLGELGLQSPVRTVEVKLRSRSEKYDVGASGLGISSPYLRGQDGRVFLLGGGVISEFDMGQGRLVDRDLHDFTSSEYDGLRVTSGGKTREFVVVAGATTAQNKLAPTESPKVPDDFAKNWHDKVWRSFATELLGRGEAIPAEAKAVFRVDYLRKGEAVGFFEYAPAEKAIYARTEHTAGWVKLSPGGEGLAIEADRVVQPDRK